jgi:hypothetical protein
MYRLLELASQFIALKYDYTFHKINKYWMLFLIPLSAFAYTAVGLCLYRCRPLLILLSVLLILLSVLLILLSAFAYTAVGLSGLSIYRRVFPYFQPARHIPIYH